MHQHEHDETPLTNTRHQSSSATDKTARSLRSQAPLPLPRMTVLFRT